MNDHNLQFANTVGLRRKMYALGRTVENNAPMIHFPHIRHSVDYEQLEVYLQFELHSMPYQL